MNDFVFRIRTITGERHTIDTQRSDADSHHKAAR
jgi:hypothetical protein